jgi:hypothetical protein
MTPANPEEERPMRAVMAVMALGAAMTGFPSSARADWFVEPKSGLQFELPAGWHSGEEDGSFGAISPDQSVMIMFDPADPRNWKKIEKQISRHVKDIQVTTAGKESTVNGLTQLFSEGTGVFQRQVIKWEITIVVGGKVPMSVIAVGAHPDPGVVKKIYDSIRKR